MQCVVVGIDSLRDADGDGACASTPAIPDATRALPRAHARLGRRGAARGRRRDRAQLHGQRWRARGYDLEQLRAARAVCAVPLVASGGAGERRAFLPTCSARPTSTPRWPPASSIPARCAIPELKRYLRAQGIEVRDDTSRRASNRRRTGLGQEAGLLPAIVQDAGNAARADARLHGSRGAGRPRWPRGRSPSSAAAGSACGPRARPSGDISSQLVSIEADCDGDTLLVQARPHGPTCHLQRASCFAGAPARLPRANSTRWSPRANASARRAATRTRLFEAGVRRIAQKVGEEGVETALAAVVQDDEALLGEAADLLFHLLVLLRARGLSLADAVAVLRARHREPRYIAESRLRIRADASRSASPACPILLSMRLVAAARAAAWVCAATPSSPSSGRSVFLDRNGNGARGSRASLASPGHGCPTASASLAATPGSYRLDAHDGRSVFVIKPAGYRVAVCAPTDCPTPGSTCSPQAAPALRYGGVPTAPSRLPRLPAAAEARAGCTAGRAGVRRPAAEVAVDVGYYERDIVAPLLAHAAARQLG